MSIYNKHTWTSNEFITTAKMNNIENQVLENSINSNLINIEHNLLNYGYSNYTNIEADVNSSYYAEKIGVTQIGTHLIFNGVADNYQIRVKLSGGIDRVPNSSGALDWTTGILLPNGHKYRVKCKFLSGTITLGTDVGIPGAVVYKTETNTSVGTATVNEYDSIREFTSDGSQYNFIFIIRAGTTLTNATYEYIVEDITEGIDGETLKNQISVFEPAAIATDVGKALIVKSVSNGKVTEYKLGETPWELIREATITNAEASEIIISADDNNNTFELTDAIIYLWLPKNEDTATFADYGRIYFQTGNTDWKVAYCTNNASATRQANGSTMITYAMVTQNNGLAALEYTHMSATATHEMKRITLREPITTYNSYIPYAIESTVQSITSIKIGSITGEAKYQLLGRRKPTI